MADAKSRYYTKMLHDVPISYLMQELNRRVNRNYEIANKLYVTNRMVSLRYGINNYRLTKLKISSVTDSYVDFFEYEHPDRTYRIEYVDIEGIYEYKLSD